MPHKDFVPDIVADPTYHPIEQQSVFRIKYTSVSENKIVDFGHKW